MVYYPAQQLPTIGLGIGELLKQIMANRQENQLS